MSRIESNYGQDTRSTNEGFWFEFEEEKKNGGRDDCFYLFASAIV